MATSFSELRKSRTKDLEKLTSEVSKLTSKEEKKSFLELIIFCAIIIDILSLTFSNSFIFLYYILFSFYSYSI